MRSPAQRLPSISELEQLRARLHEAEETLEAIRSGLVDALIVQGEQGDQVFTLKDAGEPYRLLVERMAEGALTLNLEGDILYANQRFAEMAGANLERVTGQSAAAFVQPEQRARLGELLRRAADEPLHRELCFRRADGTSFPVLLGLAPLEMEGSRLVSAIVTDLTERKRIEQVAASERFVRAILEQVSDPVLVCDVQGRITHCSHSAAALLGAELIGAPAARLPFEIVAGPSSGPARADSLAAAIEAAGAGQHVRGLEVRLAGEAGDAYLLLNGSPLQVDGAEAAGCILSFTDITARRRGEERQNLLVAELDHRVKNTLATIQSIALRTLGGGESVEALLGRIAALARTHTALSQTDWAGVELRDLVGGVFAPHEAGQGRVAWDGPPVLLDPRSAQGLALSLNELGTNASKYGALAAPEGRVLMRWAIVEAESPTLRLEWLESGGPPVAPPSKRGFGMELIEKSLRYELGAEVVVDFRPEGLRCEIVLPILAARGLRRRGPEAEPSRAARSQAKRGGLAGRLVLVAEDSHVLAAEVSSALEAAGAVVAGPVATVGQAAALTEKVDAAVLDINLDGEMIFPVAFELRARGAPVVLLTGYDGARVLPEGLRDLPVVSKPAAPEAVVAALARLLPSGPRGAA